MLVQLPHQSHIAWKVCLSILHCVAISIGAVRLWLRYRSSRMWWDDLLVILPMLFEIFLWVILLAIPPPGPTMESIIKASNFWLGLFPSFTVVWLSRICFLLLLTRLFPPGHIYRRITWVLTGIFTLIYFLLFGLSVPWCDGVHFFPPPSSLGKKNCKTFAKINGKVVFGLTSDLLSDLILVVWPVLMLYKVKLSRPKDRPIVVISLGCSTFTFLLVASIVFFNYGPIVRDGDYPTVVAMLAHMTAAVSLIVCNMPVVACAAYRAFQRARGVPPGTTVQMPEASPVSNGAGESGSASSLPPPESKEYSSGDTRLTYDDLTRISISLDMDEV